MAQESTHRARCVGGMLKCSAGEGWADQDISLIREELPPDMPQLMATIVSSVPPGIHMTYRYMFTASHQDNTRHVQLKPAYRSDEETTLYLYSEFNSHPGSI